ncbi:MAG: hypothetical protein K6F73_01715 [Lachnospiraceae bacterium]|nr:hypothetical protein [Lachnospiraceae bacterium]
MASAVFGVCSALLIAALITSTFLHERRKIAERRQAIKDSFGAAEDGCHDTDRFDNVPSLLEHMTAQSPDDFAIDDITSNDLGLRDIYSRLNRCVTSAGEDVLYCMMRIMPKNADDKLYDIMHSFIADKGRAVMLLDILDGYGKRSGTDEFALLRALSSAEEKGIISDLLPFAALIISLVMTVFFPVPAVIAAIVMIGVCVYTYFGGKRSMERNLKGLSLSLKLIGCASELANAGVSRFEQYRSIFGMRSGSFLIPYKDQSVSDPLSLIFDYVRMITHVDLIVYKIKLAKVKKHIDSLTGIYLSIGRLDTALALASYLTSRKHCRINTAESDLLDVKGLYHPLVKDPVCNDFRAERGVVLTGSNASGKSTFLKAIGISALFAKSFGFAFADSFVTGVDALYTSMALADDLLGNESYYVVEAKSIKRICDAADGRKTLCLIDEVLRGTNTVERIAASSKILEYLCKPQMLCFAATHDRELTYILEEKMDLYYFTEEISGDNVTFPFVIKKGRSDRTNAIRLLAMLGFDGGIVEGADALVARYNETGKWS